MWGLAHYGNEEDFYYDWVTGISAGSINVVSMAGWAPNEFYEFTEWQAETLLQADNADVWTWWPGEEPTIRNLYGQKSVLNSDPAIDWMTDILSEPRFVNGYKRDWTIGAVNLANGVFELFDRHNTEFGRELATAAMCSSSIPGVFPPRYFKGNYYMDGGTVRNVNLLSGIEGCLTKVATQE